MIRLKTGSKSYCRYGLLFRGVAGCTDCANWIGQDNDQQGIKGTEWGNWGHFCMYMWAFIMVISTPLPHQTYQSPTIPPIATAFPLLCLPWVFYRHPDKLIQSSFSTVYLKSLFLWSIEFCRPLSGKCHFFLPCLAIFFIYSSNYITI